MFTAATIVGWNLYDHNSIIFLFVCSHFRLFLLILVWFGDWIIWIYRVVTAVCKMYPRSIPRTCIISSVIQRVVGGEFGSKCRWVLVVSFIGQWLCSHRTIHGESVKTIIANLYGRS